MSKSHHRKRYICKLKWTIVGPFGPEVIDLSKEFKGFSYAISDTAFLELVPTNTVLTLGDAQNDDPGPQIPGLKPEI